MTAQELAGAPVVRVLIVDDDREIVNLLKARLAPRGFDVEAATSGEDAMGRLLESPPDLVFLDIEMPGMNGLDVLNLIRQRELDVAVIMTTAYGSEQVAIEALRRGADDYLRKPFDRGDFQTVLDRTVWRLRLSRHNTALQRQLDQKRQQLDLELDRAAKLQAELLPHDYPVVPCFELAAACLPALEVGGDFYDWQQLPDGTVSFTVGDVMGKGMSAALLMATVRAVLRAVVTENEPAAAVQRTAAALDGDLTRSGAFITLFHAQLDITTGHLRYVDAGHGYVVLRRADGSLEELQPLALPLGVDRDETYEEGLAVFAPGDTLVVYSDGLTEARPDLFCDCVAVAALAGQTNDASTMVGQLIAEASQVNPLPDDLTVVVLQRKPVS